MGLLEFCKKNFQTRHFYEVQEMTQNVTDKLEGSKGKRADLKIAAGKGNMDYKDEPAKKRQRRTVEEISEAKEPEELRNELESDSGPNSLELMIKNNVVRKKQMRRNVRQLQRQSKFLKINEGSED